MKIETYTAYWIGEPIICLRHPDLYPGHRIRGDWMTDSGIIDRRGHLYVRVTPDGRAWSHPIDPMGPEDYELRCEQWGDCLRIGRSFSPDEGEFERVGIKPILCGSAAED